MNKLNSQEKDKKSKNHFAYGCLKHGPLLLNVYQESPWLWSFGLVGKFRPQLIELISFKPKLLIRFIMNKTC